MLQPTVSDCALAKRRHDLLQYPMNTANPHERFHAWAEEWQVSIERSFETSNSVMGFGRCDSTDVVLKVIKRQGDEWWSGSALTAFGGRGCVRALRHAGGAVLMERLTPGNSLSELVKQGDDDEATTILAGVIAGMSSTGPISPCPTARSWAEGFARYAASGDDRVPRALALHGARIYADLCESETHPRLLHGDLHHDNVLFDKTLGWKAIDPKGVVGEVEFEIGAALRNPQELSGVMTDLTTLLRRVEIFSSRLRLDPGRVLAWAFAQAVLSAIWKCEDGESLSPFDPSIVLAESIRPLLSPVG